MLCSVLIPQTGPAFARLTLLCLSILLLTAPGPIPVYAGTSDWALRPAALLVTVPTTASCEKTFVVVEEQPVPEGGVAGLQARLRYPEDARQAEIEGRVIVQFVVDRQGQVIAPQVIRSIHPSLDMEALRIVRTTSFTPGRQGGNRVCVRVSLPLTFRLDGPSIGAVKNASRAVQSTNEAVTARTMGATEAVTTTTETVEGTAAAVDSASASVAQGIEDTKASVETTKQSMGTAASSVKKTFGGLFGRKKKTAEPAADPSASLAVGDVLTAKMDNVPLRAQPTVEASVVGPIQTTDTLIYLGTATDGFLHVQTAGGQGWVNEVLVVPSG